MNRTALLVLLFFTACDPKTKSTGEGNATTTASATNSTSSVERSSTDTPDAVAPTIKNAAKRLEVVEATQDTDGPSLIRSKRLQAKADGRVLVVYVGATWCEPCKRFKEEIASGRLDERYGKLRLLAFDADKDGDRLAAAGYTYRFIPFVALPGADGQPTDTQQATGKGGAAWRELLGKLDAWQGL